MTRVLICVVAPSGAGKSTFLNRITSELPLLFDTITYTTRSMRPGETQGSPYFFISVEEFEKKISEGFFVEWARVHGRLYGTSSEQIEEALAAGRPVIMDIDVQGALTFKKRFPEAKAVFITPPSMEVLRERLIKRDGAESPDLGLRLKNAEREIQEGLRFCDFTLVNDVFERSYLEFKKIVEALIQSR